MSITPKDIAALDGPLARLAARATEEPNLIANALCVYALHADMDSADLSSFLKLPEADLPRLFLCRWPEPEQVKIGAGKIGAYTGCHAARLQLILEATAAMAPWARLVPLPHGANRNGWTYFKVFGSNNMPVAAACTPGAHYLLMNVRGWFDEMERMDQELADCPFPHRTNKQARRSPQDTKVGPLVVCTCAETGAANCPRHWMETGDTVLWTSPPALT
jgi:hypothetical protein